MKNKALRISEHLRKYLICYISLTIISAIIIGYNIRSIIGYHKELIRNLIIILAILTLLPSMIQLRVEKFSSEFLRKRIETLTALIIVFVITPLTAIVLASKLPTRPLSIGFVAANSVPASSASIAYVLLAEGNVEFSTLLALLSILGSIILTPIYIGFYASAISVNIPMDVLSESIVLALLTPLILGQLVRYYLIKRKAKRIFKDPNNDHPCKNFEVKTHKPEEILALVEDALECIEVRINSSLKPYLSLWTMTAMLLLIGALTAAKAKLFIDNSALVGELLGLQTIIYTVVIISLLIATRSLRLTYRDHSAIAFIALTKNQSVAAAISVTAIGSTAAIPAVLIPVIQPLAAILYLWTLPIIRNKIIATTTTETGKTLSNKQGLKNIERDNNNSVLKQ